MIRIYGMDAMDYIYIGFLVVFYASMKAAGRTKEKNGRGND